MIGTSPTLRALGGGTAHADPMPAITIPDSNRRGQSRPPPRPPAGDVDERARHLVAALAGGSAESADDFSLGRDPFLAIKDMPTAARYFATLVRWYHEDIARYRAQVPAGATPTFVRFELSRACTWMTEGRETNRLPYWSCYGSRLVVRAGEREIRFRVGVMIHWGEQWFVTHLGPIPTRARSSH